jgi:hypothetical protein
LHQNLAPGQMTFVLPGGKQLAPIIVYRLDNLTKSSLLLKGFNGQLSSMPLIEQQIDKQLNLIKHGHYTDTGLLVGDDANSSQVQVIDVNTLQSAIDDSGLNSAVNKALSTDATINQSSLTDPGIPTPPTRIFLQQFILPDNTFFAGQPFTGFAGRNISFNTAGPEASTLSVDMSPYANLAEFDMVALQNINFDGSVNFDGFSPENSIYFDLVAGGQIVVAPGVTINANVANLILNAAGAFMMNASQIANSAGNMDMQFGSDATLQNGANLSTFGDLNITTAGVFNMSDSTAYGNTVEFEAPVAPAKSPAGTAGITVINSTINCSQSALLSAANDVNVTGSAINANTGSGAVNFTSTGGSVNLNNDSVQCYYLTVNSGDGILLSGTGQSFGSVSGMANLTAANTATLQNADLSGFANLTVSAKTINMYDVNLSGTVNLNSLNGLWHNGTSVFGDVNDIGGVTYNGNTVNAANGASGNLEGTGITVGKISQ